MPTNTARRCCTLRGAAPASQLSAEENIIVGKTVLGIVGLLVLITGCSTDEGTAPSSSSQESSSSSSSASNSALAFVLFLDKDDNTPTNCDAAFTALIGTPNSGVVESDRSDEVRKCIDTDMSQWD